jgi:hypothetical protein
LRELFEFSEEVFEDPLGWATEEDSGAFYKVDPDAIYPHFDGFSSLIECYRMWLHPDKLVRAFHNV